MARRILIDTGIALRYIQADDPRHAIVKSSLAALVDQGDELVLTPQTLREMWNVLTRPKDANGYGRTAPEAEGIVRLLLASFSFLDDEPGIFDDWLALVTTHEVKGVKVHDANHAAAARHHGLTHVLMLNPGDFRRYALSGLAVLTP